MVIIWLMMVNNNLVGGFSPPLWKMMELKSMGRMTSHDYPIIWWKINNVWNHQPNEHDLGILLILLNSAIPRFRHTCCQVPFLLGVWVFYSGHVRQASTQMPTLLQYGPWSTNSCSLLCFPQGAFFLKQGTARQIPRIGNQVIHNSCPIHTSCTTKRIQAALQFVSASW